MSLGRAKSGQLSVAVRGSAGKKTVFDDFSRLQNFCWKLVAGVGKYRVIGHKSVWSFPFICLKLIILRFGSSSSLSFLRLYFMSPLFSSLRFSCSFLFFSFLSGIFPSSIFPSSILLFLLYPIFAFLFNHHFLILLPYVFLLPFPISLS